MWNDNSANTKKTPDLVNHSAGIMMEHFRVLDTEVPGRTSGKFSNDRLRDEDLFHDEMKADPGYSSLPKIGEPIISSGKGAASYANFREHALRVIGKHARKIDTYRRNHPGYELAFFVEDHSEPIMGMTHAQHAVFMGSKTGESIGYHYPHVAYIDEAIVELLLSIDVDWFIWHSPHKRQFGDCSNSREFLDANRVWVASKKALAQAWDEIKPRLSHDLFVGCEERLPPGYESDTVGFLSLPAGFDMEAHMGSIIGDSVVNQTSVGTAGRFVSSRKKSKRQRRATKRSRRSNRK